MEHSRFCISPMRSQSVGTSKRLMEAGSLFEKYFSTAQTARHMPYAWASGTWVSTRQVENLSQLYSKFGLGVLEPVLRNIFYALLILFR